jgi:hypothetical protein
MDKREYKGGTNKRTVVFKVHPTRLLNVEIEQIGLADNTKFAVRTFVEFRKDRYGAWHTDDMEVTEYPAREDALKHFTQLTGTHKKTHEVCYIQDYKRPVCDDPKERDYCDANFSRVSNKGSKPYNCYSVNDTVYSRADGQPITQQDLEHFRAFPGGQIHGVYGEPGDETLRVHSECDSSG